MSVLLNFVDANKHLTLPLKSAVVKHLYGNDLPNASHWTPFPPTKPISIGSSFKAFPVLPAPESPNRLAERVGHSLKRETSCIHVAILDAIQAMVENNAELFWNHITKHTAYIHQRGIERELQSKLGLNFELCYNDGRFEGISDGKKVIRHIFGNPMTGNRKYHFRMDKVGVDGDDSRANEKHLPVQVVSQQDRAILHSMELDTIRDVLAELDMEIEALLALRTKFFLDNSEDSEDEDQQVILLQKNIRCKVAKSTLSIFLLGKYREFEVGQRDEKRCYGLEDSDTWVYDYVHDEDGERIFIRDVPKRPFYHHDSDSDSDNSDNEDDNHNHSVFTKRQKVN